MGNESFFFNMRFFNKENLTTALAWPNREKEIVWFVFPNESETATKDNDWISFHITYNDKMTHFIFRLKLQYQMFSFGANLYSRLQ